MAITSLSPEATIREIMDRLDLSAAFVSALAGHAKISKASAPTLTAGLYGGKGLKYETAQPLLELLRNLDLLVSTFAPVEIRLTNAEQVHGWLKDFEAGKIKLYVRTE